MASRPLLVNRLREYIAQHDTPGARVLIATLCNSLGFIKGAPALLDWALESGHQDIGPHLIPHLTAKEAAQVLFRAGATPPWPATWESALWSAAGDVEASCLAVRENDEIFFERAQSHIRGNHHTRVFNQALSEAIRTHQATWVTRLLGQRQPNLFHAQALGAQDVPADSPLLAAFVPALDALAPSRAVEDGLQPAGYHAVVRGHHGPFRWALDQALARDADWCQKYPLTRWEDRTLCIRKLTNSLLPTAVREGRLEWLDDLLPLSDVNHDDGRALRIAVETRNAPMVARLLAVADVDIALQYWIQHDQWREVDAMADWVTPEKRQAWFDAHGAHLPRLSARLRDDAAQEKAPDRAHRHRSRA